MKAAIYCRLSEEDKNKQSAYDESSSIKNQKAMLLQYAAEQGWVPYDIYSDDDYAGADRKRPEFNRLLEDAEERRFDIILCKTQSRFTRELELVEKYIHGLFPLWGIRFVSIVDNADTANKGNKKSRQINGLVNEWYLEDMSDNIRSVLTNKRENGLHIGSFALYGYQKDPNQKGHLVIDEEAAVVVREVFTLFSKGCGKTAIARMLNDRGIPNPTEYKRLHGLRYQQPKMKNSTLWSYSSISDMLENQIYTGSMVQGKYGSISYKTKQNKPRPKSEWYIVEDTHLPIIDRELWEKVKALREERAKPFAGGAVGLFARKARCAGCGCTMRSSKNHNKHYLRCSGRYASKDVCEGSFISVDRLEQAVIGELKRLAADYLDKDELERGIECFESVQKQKDRLRFDITVFEKKLAKYARGARELYMDKLRGVITGSEFAELSKDLASEKERVKQAADTAKRQLAGLETPSGAGSRRRELIEQYTNPDHLTRELVEALIDFVTIGRRIPGTRNVPIEIHWNF